MPDRIPFFKYSATGNDFILIDNRAQRFTGAEKNLFFDLCARKTGIGADGILLIEPPRHENCSFTMRYFNRDGCESEMCGNGARASAYHAKTINRVAPSMKFEVNGDVYHAEVVHDRVRLRMQEPRDLRLQVGALQTLGVPAPAELTEGGYVNTGVPHLVLFVEAVAQIDVENLGRALRHHRAFAPAGTNVNFIEIVDGSHVSIRTYERGVEEETLACGTGAVASALIAQRAQRVNFPVHLSTRGGELVVSREADSNRLLLEGQVKQIFTGEFELWN
jgi:diaminopimelate epimerase